MIERVGDKVQNNARSQGFQKFSFLRMEERNRITSNIQKDCGWFEGKGELQFLNKTALIP